MKNKGQLLIRNISITAGDCFRSFIRHVSVNKGQLLIRNTFITPGDCFCKFIWHVRENKAQLLIRNTFITVGDCLCIFIRHLRENKYSFGTPSLHLVISYVLLHFVLLYGMRGEIKDSYSFTIPLTPGDCFCTFIRHVRENKYSFGTPSLHLVIAFVLLHGILYFYTACEGK